MKGIAGRRSSQDEGMLASHEAGLERDLFPHGISDVDVEHAPMRVLQWHTPRHVRFTPGDGECAPMVCEYG